MEMIEDACAKAHHPEAIGEKVFIEESIT